MFMRISKRNCAALAALAALSACGLTEDRSENDIQPPATLAAAENAVEQQAADDGKIECAVSGATIYTRACQIEQAESEKGLLLTVRHPDGGFRRLQVVKDGRGVIAADGADQAKVTITGDKQIEVELAGDHYRLPATQKSVAAKPAKP